MNQFYRQQQILRDISLELPRGQCTCLLGRNIVGKTTLVNCKVPPMVHALFPVLHAMRHHRAGELTESQQQQLAIARALVLQPELLILDEPTGGFQPAVVREIGITVRRLQHEFGLTLLLVEPQLPFGAQAGDRFCLLEGGRNVAQGALDQLDDGLIQTYQAV